MSNHPPKPRLALSVGIIGHRPNRLPENTRADVIAQVKEVLNIVQQSTQEAYKHHSQFFADEAPTLTLLSAVAEGADRIAAISALDKGYALTAVLPFDVKTYQQEFREASSKTEYKRLLEKAERILVLPGTRAQETVAYETAGLTILDNADILLAVWDGEASAGRGGTTDLIERAARDDIPIIHIDAKNQFPPRILWHDLATFPAAGIDLLELPSSSLESTLPNVVEKLLRPPSSKTESNKLLRYLEEPRRSWNGRIEVPLLLALLALRPFRLTDIRPKEPAALATDFQDNANSFAAQQSEHLHASSKFPPTAAFGWADALAVRYAQIFRGAYISNFVCAAFAVLAGATSLVGTQLLAWPSWPLALVETGFVIFIFGNTFVGTRRDWHTRWRESREVAERLRATNPLWLVARSLGSPRGGEPTWPAWYSRAHLRAAGLVAGAIDVERREEILRSLAAIVDSQSAYHKHVAELMHGVERRVNRIGQGLFALTFLFGAVNLATALGAYHLPFHWSFVLTGLAASLPALGAATFGIRLIGDFEGVAKRSERTCAGLAGIGDALRQDSSSLAVLRSRARAIADAMLGDMQHWRMTTETRKLIAPA